MSLKRLAQVAASVLLVALATSIWAAQTKRAAHLFAQRAAQKSAAQKRRPPFPESGQVQGVLPIPETATFREEQGRGLLTLVWINGAGPYRFAIDTGAGATILSERVAGAARVAVHNNRTASIVGMSGVGSGTGREASLKSLAIGSANNILPARGATIIASGLPPDIDGVLDPTESYWPFGYILDLPRKTIAAFNPRLNPLTLDDVPAEGTVAEWLTDGRTRRPFVALTDGTRVLIDTGSGFGFAISQNTARAMGISVNLEPDGNQIRDIGGGRIPSRRIRPLTVHIGALVLRNVPTDLLSGVEAGAPVLLGRDALRPFQIAFDPIHKLIRLAPE